MSTVIAYWSEKNYIKCSENSWGNLNIEYIYKYGKTVNFLGIRQCDYIGKCVYSWGMPSYKPKRN